jgi:hypothetical protein
MGQFGFLLKKIEFEDFTISSQILRLHWASQQHQRHIPIPPKFSASETKIIFNIQELLHHKSKRHETKPMHPSLSRAFQRHQERGLKHPGGSVDLITTKQNKLPSFID